MFKNLTVVLMTVLMATAASAQTKKKAAKKKTATPKAEQPLPETAPATAEATPAPVAEPEPAAAPSPARTGTGKGTQFAWQPAEGQSAAELLIAYGMTKYDVTPAASGYTADVKATLIDFTYGYGLTQQNALGVTLGMSTSASSLSGSGGGTAELKTSGLHDIYLGSVNWLGMGDGQFLYGVTLGFSPGKNKIPQSVAMGHPKNEDGTSQSGGMSLPIYLGYQSEMSSGSWVGVKLTYGMMLERSTDFNGTDVKTTGGNTLDLKAFYESQSEPCHWNAYLGFTSTGEAESKAGAGAPTKTKATSGLEFGGSWGTYLNPGMLLALHYGGVNIAEVDNTTTKTAAHLIHTLGVRGRWEF